MSELKFKVGDIVKKAPGYIHPDLKNISRFVITASFVYKDSEDGECVNIEGIDGNWTTSWFELDKAGVINQILSEL